MLYDPKWEVKTKEPSITGLVAWLETKDPSAEYDYNNCVGGCLIGQYLNHVGLKWDRMWPTSPGINYFNSDDCASLRRISVPRPRTFGGALERARAAAKIA